MYKSNQIINNNNNKINFSAHPIDEENKQGILLDNKSTCFHILVNGQLLKDKVEPSRINYINFIQMSCQKDQDIYVSRVKELLQLTNEKQRLFLVMGINLKVSSCSFITKRMNPQLVISMETIQRIKEIGIPVLIVGYRWCSKRLNNDMANNPYQIIKNINKVYKSFKSDKDRLKYKEQIEQQDKLHSFPFGKTRSLLFKNKASITFIKLVSFTGLTYLHCQDSDFTSLNSISKYYPPSTSTSNTTNLYERCDEMIYNSYNNNLEFPLVFGGSYNFTNCLNDINSIMYPDMDHRINVSEITDCAINLSNEIKNIISKVSPRNIYFTEANTFIISPFSRNFHGSFKRFGKNFKHSNFGDVNEMGELLVNLFIDQSEINLKKQLIYDPSICISTSTIRSGKDNFSIDKYSGSFNKETGKFINVNVTELYGQSQSVLSTRKISEALLVAFKNIEPLPLPLNQDALTNTLKSIATIIKELDPLENNTIINDTQYINNFQFSKEVIDPIESSFPINFNNIIQVIRNISLAKLSMKLKYFESFSNQSLI